MPLLYFYVDIILFFVANRVSATPSRRCSDTVSVFWSLVIKAPHGALFRPFLARSVNVSGINIKSLACP